MLNPILNNPNAFYVLDYTQFAPYVDNYFKNCNILSEKFLNVYFNNDLFADNQKIELY